jgi:methionyl-tRNA formyltransferase
MILIGEGALLSRALRYCGTAGLPVQGVVSPLPLPAAAKPWYTGEFQLTTNVNRDADFIASHNQDGIVWSLNNRFLLRRELLSLPQIRYYNIHNGLVQRHRGLPEISIFFALLRDEPDYGVTLHEIDEGIDTGPALAQRSTPISAEDTFGTLMRRSLDLCLGLFEEFAPRLARGELIEYLKLNYSASRNFNYRMLAEAKDWVHSSNWRRAADLGPYVIYFPKLQAALQEMKSAH